MNLVKMFGFFNVLTLCLPKFSLCNVKANSFLNPSYRRQVCSRLHMSSFDISMKMEDRTNYPEWGYKIAPEHDKYDVIERRYNRNFDFVYTVYQHKATKMQVINIGSNDPLDIEQAFTFYIKTLPHTDEGIPHILEHAVLSSSHKYKDPFTTLMKGSLYTLLNAYTYNDRTLYVARSVNNRDFFNILDVYIDCVFRPSVLENKSYFLKEGWHYMLTPMTEEEKKNSKLPRISDFKVSYNGIVYNEMKGVFSNPMRILLYETFKSLFPDNVHAKVSGGDPQAITQLTYESFQNFYTKNYSPEKVKLLASSNKSCKELLDFVDAYLGEIDLKKYKWDEPVENVELQKYLEGPFYVEKKYASNSAEKESMVAVSWLLNPAKRNEDDMDFNLDDPEKYFLVPIIQYILIQTPTSILYKALIESGLGTGVINDLADSDIVQYMFSVGLKGINESKLKNENAELSKGVHYAVEKIILDTLEKEVKKGFNRDAVEAAINMFMFHSKESYLESGKGTQFMLEMIAKLNYNRDPLQDFEYDVYLNKIKENVEKVPNYLENFVTKYFLNNKHRVVVYMKGDDNCAKEQAEKEQTALKSKIDSMSEKEKEEIVKTFKDLQDKSQVVTPEDIDNIPSLSLSDLNEKTLEVPVTLYFTNSQKEEDFEQYLMTKKTAEHANRNLQYFRDRYVLKKGSKVETPESVKEEDIPLLIHEVDTEGILYLQFAFVLDEFTLEEFYYINLFKALILENKTSKRSEEDFVLLKEKNVGRLRATVQTYGRFNHLNVLNKYNAGALFNLEIHVLSEKSNEGLDIALEALAESDFSNKKKVIEILNRFVDQHKTSFVEDAEIYLSNHVSSKFTSNNYLKNVMSGIKNYKKLLEILESAKTDYDSVENMLKKIRNKLLNNTELIVNITADKESLKHLFTTSKVAFKNFLSYFKNKPSENKVIVWNEEIKKGELLETKETKDLFIIPTLVNYVGMAGTIFEKDEQINPSYMVVISALQNTYLWSTIRELNGAYGVMASLSYYGYVFFASYRDPHLEKTLETYRKSIQGLRDMADKMTPKELVRYIVFYVRKLDKPLRGLSLGNTSFWRILHDESEQDRVDYRRSVLSTTKQHFYDFADLLQKKLNELEKTIVAVTSNEQAQAFNEKHGNFNIIPLE